MRPTLPLITLLALATPALAATHTFEANLDSTQEVPPNVSPAIGFVDLSLNDVTGAFTLSNGSYQDLLGTSTAATLNGPALAGANAPTLFVLTLDNPGNNTGTFSDPAPGPNVLTPAQITDIEAGKDYINIRSNVFPSGEIRGQLFETPEPTTLALLLLATPLTLRRRQKI